MSSTISIQIVDGPVQVDPLIAPTGAGALLVFDGVIRPNEEGRALLAIRYQAYEPMAQQVMMTLAGQVCARLDLLAMHAWHSRGEVAVGMPSFRLVVAGRHRKEALQGMAEFIDRLKVDVPIWKIPVFADQSSPASPSSATV